MLLKWYETGQGATEVLSFRKRVPERAPEWRPEQASERAPKWALERASEQAPERASERPPE